MSIFLGSCLKSNLLRGLLYKFVFLEISVDVAYGLIKYPSSPPIPQPIVSFKYIWPLLQLVQKALSGKPSLRCSLESSPQQIYSKNHSKYYHSHSRSRKQEPFCFYNFKGLKVEKKLADFHKKREVPWASVKKRLFR